jgi:hypothetical protein
MQWNEKKQTRTIIRKPDLDTCMTALLCDINRGDKLCIMEGAAMKKDLSNPEILCIEAGGSGQVYLNNFDHHNSKFHLPPACIQVCERYQIDNPFIRYLVDYVALVDQAVPITPVIVFPSLSNIFSGMRLFTPSVEEQFWKGISILEIVLAERLDPFLTMPFKPEWRSYIKAKEASRKKLNSDLEKAEYYISTGKHRIGYIETEAPGAIGGLYGYGCNIAIAFNPVRKKYTIGGRGVDVYQLLTPLNVLERGWGGHATIIGSREGSGLDKEEIYQITRVKL